MGLLLGKLPTNSSGRSSSQRPLRISINRRRQLLPKYERNTPWSIIYNTHYTDWVRYNAEKWTFDPGPYCITGKELNPMQVSPYGLQFEVVEISVELHGKCGTNLVLKERTNKEINEFHTLHLPYRLKVKSLRETKSECSGLRPLQVCGYSKNIVILQALCKDHHLQFIVWDIHSGEFLGKYAIKWTWEPFICECLVSPDHTHFLLKPSVFYANEMENGDLHPYLKEIRVINLSNGQCKLEQIIRDVHCAKYVMAYDPRFSHTRVAIGNWHKENSGNGTALYSNVMCLMDTRKQEPLANSAAASHQITQNLVYSPDGSFLASLINEPCYYQGFHSFPQILVFDSDSLDIVHSINCSNTQCVPLYPAILFPSFSKCGTRMVAGYGRDIDIMGSIFGQEVAYVDVYKMPIPINLQYLCRVAIRRCVHKEKELSCLPLPKPLVQYLSFDPILE